MKQRILIAAGMMFLLIVAAYVPPVPDSECITVKPEPERQAVSGMTLTELAANLEQKQGVARQEKYIADCIAGMTVEQKLAQMLILTAEKDMTVQKLEEFKPGGVIFFDMDYNGKTTQDVKQRVQEMQASVTYPLFIGVDEEGGQVSRVAGLSTDMPHQFKSARQLYEGEGIDAVRQVAVDKMSLLQEMGMNLNFDPVADVVEQPEAYMYDRAASGDVNEVSQYVAAVVEVMQEKNMGCCLKHFPGYGNNVNTHNQYAVDEKSILDYRQREFVPFQTGIEQGADMVMVSHIVIKALDDEHPASLSKEVHALLREELEFSGVIISDDLNMRAILKDMTLEQASAAAVLAGNDMIFSADFETSMRGLKGAVEAGELSEAQIDESVARIFTMKINRGIMVME